MRQKALEHTQRRKRCLDLEKRNEDMMKSAEEQIASHRRKCRLNFHGFRVVSSAF